MKATYLLLVALITVGLNGSLERPWDTDHFGDEACIQVSSPGGESQPSEGRLPGPPDSTRWTLDPESTHVTTTFFEVR